MIMSYKLLLSSIVAMTFLMSSCFRDRLDERIERTRRDAAMYLHPDRNSHKVERDLALRTICMLESLTAKQLRKSPVLLGAWSLPHADAETFIVVYWLEATPSVDSVLFMSPSHSASEVVAIPLPYQEQNLEDAKYTVLFYSTFLWQANETPLVLMSEDCVIQLMRGGVAVSGAIAVEAGDMRRPEPTLEKND